MAHNLVSYCNQGGVHFFLRSPRRKPLLWNYSFTMCDCLGAKTVQTLTLLQYV